MNALVEMVRSWLDDALVNVAGLHAQLVPEHFRNGEVPPLHKLRARLNGVDIDWDLVEAVAEVCIPHEEEKRAQRLLREARDLWLAAESNPTPLTPRGAEVMVRQRDLVAAQEIALSAQQSLTQAQQQAIEAQRELSIVQGQAIDAYQELDQARQALGASERGRQQALQIGTVVFAMLGSAQATVRELERRIDAKKTWPAAFQSDGLGELRDQLQRAEAQERDLRDQLARAERDRLRAQEVADFTARRIQVLEVELLHYKELSGEPLEDGGSSPKPHRDDLEPIRPMDVGLDDMDRAIERVRSVLDQEHDAVEEAAEGVGWRAPLGQGELPAGSPGPSPGLFQTTPDNHDSPSAARVLALAQQTADQAISEARSEANRIVAEARAHLEEAEEAKREASRALADGQLEVEVLNRRREDIRVEINRVQGVLEALHPTGRETLGRPSEQVEPSGLKPDKKLLIGDGSWDVNGRAARSDVDPKTPIRRRFAALLTTQLHTLGSDHPETLATQGNIAAARGIAGDAAGAAQAFAELVEDRVRLLGPDHPDTLTTRHNLAVWLGQAGNLAGAAQAFADLVEDRVRLLGPDHPDTLTTRHNLANMEAQAGDVARAVESLTNLLIDQERVLGLDHPDVLNTRGDLAYWRGTA
ncbi:tetratricopeptide repeat protein [Streptomyces globisporus]|uniref:tetratricopeptide repeat protein n=1 Tax=Streptomyces globisporus TaxID=1908 RepID=UPI003687B895